MTETSEPIALRPGLSSDAIDLMVPTTVARPRSISEFRQTLRDASSSSTSMVITGNRTKIEWGLPPESLDLIVETGGLPKIVEHAASDLVVRVSSNVELEELQQELGRNNQRLAIDSVVRRTTIGGLIATGISGPLRYGFGSVKDLLIGVTAIRSDGVLASSGGRVVKNVAGYDLAKLYTGSYGTLGAITEAFFRLHAIPESSRYLTCQLPVRQSRQALANLTQTQTSPSAIEIYVDSSSETMEIGVLIEGLARGVDDRAERCRQEIGAEISINDKPPDWWGALPGTTTFKITTEIAQIATVVSQLSILSLNLQLAVTVTGSAGVGVLFVGIDIGESTTKEQTVALSRGIRTIASKAGGASVVLRGPSTVRAAIDVWGPIPAIDLMRRVKEQFDPAFLLAPGRFVGGL